MPELPEVETIVRRLCCGGDRVGSILGKQVAQAHLYWARTLSNSSEKQLNNNLKGEVVQEIGRRGKFILIRFHQLSLLIHLRMSGFLRVEQPLEKELQKHDRLMLEFSDGWRLVLNDTRKFGRVWLVSDPREILSALGPEPLDQSLTPSSFHQMLIKRRRQLKPLLLDQTFLAGLGNIYTDEALYLARLNPLRLSSSLLPADSFALLNSIRSVLNEGIQRNGASIDWVYRGGEFQNHFCVYQRQGQPCLICGSLIKRIRLGQRSTYFCPVCQPLPPVQN